MSSEDDYRFYQLSRKELTDYYITAGLLCLVLGMLFYNSLWAALIIMCASPLFEKKYAGYLLEKRRKKILEGFKDALYTISASISAGRQLPRAISDAAQQSELFYGSGSIIAKELGKMAKIYKRTNMTMEKLLSEFAQRSGVEEISLFARACAICRENGGDMERLCLRSAYMIIEKIEFMEETEAILAEKKLDIIILLAMPPIVLLFLNINSFEYIEPLYAGLRGRVIMTASLLMMAMAILWSLRIMQLKL